MRVITLAGSPRYPSRSSALLEYARETLSAADIEVCHWHLQNFAPEDLLYARFDNPALHALNEQLAGADGLIIATPVYKASFSGALKTLLDLLPERAARLLDLKLEGLREAPIGIVVACDRRTPANGVLGRATFTETDVWSCACAIQNMWLTARSLGLGMGWVTLFEPSDLAGLIVGESLTDETRQKGLVDRFLSELESGSATTTGKAR